jgi:hypothetical protein
MKRRTILAILAVLTVCLANTAAASAAPGELSFVEPEKVAVTYDSNRSDEVSVWLKNDGAREVTPEFTTVIEGGNGKAALAAVEVVGEGAKAGKAEPVAARQIARYRLVFLNPSKSSGQLVASAKGMEPASLPLSIGEDLSSTHGVDAALLIPLGLAVAFLVIAWFCGHGDKKLTDTLGGAAEIDFTKSFASTLTAVGALLGTIIAAGVLPEETVNLSKGAYVGLNLTFGVAIVIAAAVAGSFFTSKAVNGKEGAEWKVKGYVWPFMLGALVTLWAVFGEMYTTFWLIGELGAGEGFTLLGITMLRVLLVAGVIALLPYTILKVGIAVKTPVPEPDAPTGPAAPRAFTIARATEAAGGGDELLAVEIPTEAIPTVEPAARPVPLL